MSWLVINKVLFFLPLTSLKGFQIVPIFLKIAWWSAGQELSKHSGFSRMSTCSRDMGVWPRPDEMRFSQIIMAVTLITMMRTITKLKDQIVWLVDSFSLPLMCDPFFLISIFVQRYYKGRLERRLGCPLLLSNQLKSSKNCGPVDIVIANCFSRPK